MTGKLSLRFLAAAIVYFLLVCFLGLAMLFRLLILPGILAVHTHIALLGFVSSTIIGTIYQQVPNLSGTRLYSEKLGEASFWLLNVGLIGFSLGIAYYGFTLVPLIFSLLMVAAVYAFALNTFMTLKNRGAWNYILWFYALSAFYFVIAATIGFTIMLGRAGVIDLWSFLPNGSMLIASHAHIALLGWVSAIIIGAMAWMLPMVAMKNLHSTLLMKIVLWIFNIGVVGFFLSLLTRGFGPLTIILALLVISGAFQFIYVMFKTITGTAKIKKVVSTEAKFFEAALVYFAISLVLGLVMLVDPSAWRISFGHAHLALLGWVTITIFGGMYNVVPTLVWSEMREKGAQPLPAGFKGLYSERRSQLIFWLANIGIIGLFVGSLVSRPIAQLSGAIFALSALIFSCEMLCMAKKG